MNNYKTMKQITSYHMPTPTCFGTKMPSSGNLSTAKFIGPTRISGADHHHCHHKVNISTSIYSRCCNNNTTQRRASLVTHSRSSILPGLFTHTSISIYDPTVCRPAEEAAASVWNTCWIYETFLLINRLIMLPKHVEVSTWYEACFGFCFILL
jgi:hypothetical protein